MGSLVGDPARTQGDGLRLRVVDERETAFRALTDRHLDGAYRLASVILGDRLEAEDAVHDAALSAWRSFAGLRDHGVFEGWFRRIVVNACRDRLRSRSRRRVVDLGRELTDLEHPVVPDPSEHTVIRDALERALDRLDPDARVVVTLRFHGDLTVPAIAEALGVPEGTVKSRLHNAMGRLLAAMEEADR